MATFEDEIKKITDEVIQKFVIPDFEKRGHDASGNWLANIGSRVEPNKGIITGTDYTYYLIHGRGPNNDQDPSAINRWVRGFGKNVFAPWIENKGLNLNPYAVAYSIARTGTKTYKEGGSDFLQILESKEVQDYIISRLTEFYINDVKVKLSDSLRKLSKA